MEWFSGFAPCLIAQDRLTVAGLLKKKGYATAIVGKWHLDLQYQDPKSGKILAKGKHKRAPIGATIPDGPVHRGFDYFHGNHHAGHMDTIIENDRVIERLDEIHNLPRLTEKSVEYIQQRAKLPTIHSFSMCPSVHLTPLSCRPKNGRVRVGLGDYGDFVMQTDATVGAISSALAKHGFRDNTLIIFTSDNGCSKAAGIPQLRATGSSCQCSLPGIQGRFLGRRSPGSFYRSMAGVVEAGSESDQLITLVDMFATASEITGCKSTYHGRGQCQLSACTFR